MATLDVETQRLTDIQEEYEQYLEALDEAKHQYDEDPTTVSYQRTLEKAYMKMHSTEQKFKDAINTLLVDCLEAVVTNDEKKKGEKFALLEKFGKGSGFTNAEKMVKIGAAHRGGERYAHRR